MDKRIRRNERCVIGLPRCDFVFSSTRTAFVGYGFAQSSLEMAILRSLLEKRGMQLVEAGGTLAPGQNAFCAKICSKIILSQFCIILLNNDLKNNIEIPNANVNMEYGLMLGFNKYVLPFQRQTQDLPFNVAGLDTVKYTNEDFEPKAAKAIDIAIEATTQDEVAIINPDQILESFLLSQRLLLVPLNSEGDRNLYELGRPLGFNLLSSFDGLNYSYFGNFTALRPEAVLWRLRTLVDILNERMGSVPERMKMGFPGITPASLQILEKFMRQMQFMLLVTADDNKAIIEQELGDKPIKWPVKVFSLSQIETDLRGLV